MNRAWSAAVVVLVVVTAVVAYAHTGHAAALNETGLPEEAEGCGIDFPASASVGPGDPVLVGGSVIEGSVLTTAGPSPVPEIIAEAGFGPIGSDPRTDAGWSFTSMAVTDASDSSSIDEYEGTIVAPLPVNTTQYSLAVRFSFDSGLNHTYCDLDGAGSFPGLDFDPAGLGVLTVTGTGGADNGSVTTTIEAQEAPGPCILLSTSNIDYGTAAFSTPLTPRSASGEVTITNCGVEQEDILARGADATGPSATWTLANPPGPSGNICALASGGINQYAHTLDDGNLPAVVALTNVNQTYQAGLSAGANVPTDTTFHMPCSGSDGAGELMSTSITFTALAVELGP